LEHRLVASTCINFGIANAAPRILRGSKQERLAGVKVAASAVDGVAVGSRIIGTPLAIGRFPPKRPKVIIFSSPQYHILSIRAVTST
jgi:hypothetical protein